VGAASRPRGDAHAHGCGARSPPRPAGSKRSVASVSRSLMWLCRMVCRRCGSTLISAAIRPRDVGGSVEGRCCLQGLWGCPSFFPIKLWRMRYAPSRFPCGRHFLPIRRQRAIVSGALNPIDRTLPARRWHRYVSALLCGAHASAVGAALRAVPARVESRIELPARS